MSDLKVTPPAKSFQPGRPEESSTDSSLEIKAINKYSFKSHQTAKENKCTSRPPTPSSIYSDDEQSETKKYRDDQGVRKFLLEMNEIISTIYVLNGQKKQIIDALHQEDWNVKEAERLEDEALFMRKKLNAEEDETVSREGISAASKHWKAMQLKTHEARCHRERERQKLGEVNLKTLKAKRELEALDDKGW